MLWHVSVFHSFLWLNNILLYQCTTFFFIYFYYHILFTHLPVDNYWGCFYFLSTMNNAIMNIHAHIFLWINSFFSLGYIPRSAVSYSNSMFKLPCNCRLFHIRGFQLLHILINTWYYLFCCYSYPHGYEAISHCGFNLHFSND